MLAAARLELSKKAAEAHKDAEDDLADYKAVMEEASKQVAAAEAAQKASEKELADLKSQLASIGRR